MNCTPKVRHKTFGVQFVYEAFIKREITIHPRGVFFGGDNAKYC